MSTGLLGKVRVGGKEPVVVMGVINLSSDSFFRGSVASGEEVVSRARAMVEEGAKIIDIGAMATGPGSNPVPPAVERDLLLTAVRAIARELDVTLSVDTQRSGIAAEAVSAGASVVNDVTGLKGDQEMVRVLESSGCSAILMASNRLPGDVCGMREIRRALGKSLDICRQHGVSLRKIALDPAVGHWPARLARFREKGTHHRGYSPATSHDLQIIMRLGEFGELGRPICVGISRKSFIGEVLGAGPPEDRLIGSLAATAIAVLNGTAVVRTHDVKETVEAVKTAEAMRNAR